MDYVHDAAAASRSPPMARRCARPSSTCPQPHGSEVLVRVDRCGVCHSDLHMQDGYFLLGDDKKLDVRARPHAAVHARPRDRRRDRARRAGRRRRPAPGARSRSIPGSAAAPARPAGAARRTSAPRRAISASMSTAASPSMCWCRIRAICSTMRRLPPSFAGALMCSGLTAYAALKRLAGAAPRTDRCCSSAWAASA